MVRVRIERGQSSIEVEGTSAEVGDILTKYWSVESLGETAVEPEPSGGPNGQKGIIKTRVKRLPSTASQSDGNAKDKLDHEKLANDLKSRADFGVLKAKILDAPGDWINKCRMVALVAGAPITSGDVSRVLTTLRIRSALPTLSRTLSGNSTEFLTTGNNPVRYEMTAAAEDAFRRWLVANEE